jgi:hypothetical protein
LNAAANAMDDLELEMTDRNKSRVYDEAGSWPHEAEAAFERQTQ